MSKELLRVLAALVCVLATCADVTPVKDFSLEKVRQRERCLECIPILLSLYRSQ